MASSTDPSTGRPVDEHLRDRLEQNNIPAPDTVQETHGELTLVWADRQVAVVIALEPGMPA